MRSGEEELHDYLAREWTDDTPEIIFSEGRPLRTESILLWGRFRAFLRAPIDPSMPGSLGTYMWRWAIDQRHPGEITCPAVRCPDVRNNAYAYLFSPVLLGTENHAFSVGAPYLRGPQGGFVQRLTWIDFVPNGFGDVREMRFVQIPECRDPSAPGCEMNDIQAFSAGFDRVCFRRLEGQWYCGHEDRRSFVRVPWMDTQVGTLHMGKQSHFACFLTPGGAVRCWGEDNTHGQVGDGTRTPRAQAVTILGG